MTPEGVGEAVEAMLRARREMRPIPGLPEAGRPKTFDEAYLIQDALVQASGQGIGGWKVGCTSEAAQKMLKVKEPFFGPVFSPLMFRSPAEPSAGSFHMIGVECEFAFRMGRDLPPREESYDRERIIDSVQALVPAIEVISTRFDDFTRYGGLQIAADCGANGALVLGQEIRDWRDIDLEEHKVTLILDGLEKASGTGAAVLGHPLNALIWFVGRMQERGRGLRTGEVISTGTCTGIAFVDDEQQVVADFGSLGTVEVKFRR